MSIDRVKKEATSVFLTFDEIPKIINMLERNKIKLVKNLHYIELIIGEITALQGARFEPIKNKKLNTLEKNRGCWDILKISKCIQGDDILETLEKLPGIYL